MISQKTRNSLLYLFAILVVIFGSIILVALAQGYEYDFLHNQIKVTGLVLIGSQPSGATINVDDHEVKPKTPYRIENAAIGPLKIKLTKAEYRDWQSSFVVQPGEVAFADYALLLPSNLNYKVINPDTSFTQLVNSDDHKRQFAVSQKPLGIWQIETDRSTQLYSPGGTAGKPEEASEEITGLQVSSDGSAMLFQQKNASGQISNMYLALGNSQAVNVSQEFGFNLAQLYFNPVNSHELYWLDNNSLRRINLDNKTVTAVLVGNIASLQIRRDRILVVEPPNSSKSEQNFFSYNLDGGDKKLVAAMSSDALGYELDYSKGRFNDYMAARAKGNNEFYLVRDPLGSARTTSVFTKEIKAFTFSPNGRFLVLDRMDQLKSYDLEFTQVYDYHYSLAGLSHWQWYNNYHLLITSNQKTSLVDFDGQNSYEIQQAGASTINAVPLEPDKYIDYLSPAGQVTRADLVLKR